jgi:hypothetical protein
MLGLLTTIGAMVPATGSGSGETAG